jgi:tetratricopeptide (TPR) repeat protein
LEEAADHYAKALQVNPDFDRVYFDLAGVNLTLNRYSAALEVLAKARARFPENFLTEFYTGLAMSGQKQYREALKNFTAAEVLGAAKDTNLLTHFFYYHVGIACERTQDYEGAEKNFKKSIALSPEYAPALNYLGYMWVDRDENLEEARRLIERALKVEPKNAAFLDSLGWALFKQKQPREALERLLEAVRQSSEEDATLYDHLGDIYAQLQEAEKARESWRKSLALEPNDQVQKKLEAASQSDSIRK